MSLAAAELPKPAVVSFDDDAWEDLLNFIEEEQVIPIIGPELLIVQTEAGPENLYAWIARACRPTLACPVISDEDALEFGCALQSRHYAPEKFFGELEHNHLLLLGGGFSDWLTRLFLRLAKRRRLSEPRDVGETLADSRAPGDPGLVFFLQQVSSRTRLFAGGADSFVDELHRRWMARRNPTAIAAPSASAPVRFTPPARDMADQAVFISYAREDLAAVLQLKAGLDAAGIRA